MATVAPQDSIDLGRVITRSIDALFKNALPFFTLSLLLAGLPTLAMQWWMLSSLGNFATDPEAFLSERFWGMTAASIVVAGLSSALAQAILVRSTILHLGGRPIEIGQSVAVAFGLLLPVVALWILVSIMIVVGLILLIVPGVILALMFCVAVPALVEERGGVFASLSRSKELTSGSKLLILVLMVIYVLFSWIIGFAFGSFAGIGALTTGTLIFASVGEAVAATITTAVSATLFSSLYIELRTMKEGASPDVMAEIFS